MTHAVSSVVANSNDSCNRLEKCKQLFELFKSKAESLSLDGTIVENGTIRVSTIIGAMLTNDNVIGALCKRYQRQLDEQRRKEKCASQKLEKNDLLHSRRKRKHAKL